MIFQEFPVFPAFSVKSLGNSVCNFGVKSLLVKSLLVKSLLVKGQRQTIENVMTVIHTVSVYNYRGLYSDSKQDVNQQSSWANKRFEFGRRR